MGTWSKLTAPDGTPYPDKPIEYEGGSERQIKMFARIDELKELATAVITAQFDAAKARKEELAKLEKENNFELEACTRALTSKLQGDEMETVVINGYRYTQSPEPHITVADKSETIPYLVENLPAYLDVSWNALNSAVKTFLKGGEDCALTELPPGVEIYMKRGIHRTKVK